MKSDQQNNSTGPRLTIFKPPGYIYKLSKAQNRNGQNTQYETYFNGEYSLRKYSRTISMGSQSELALYEWRKQTASPVLKVVYLELLNRTISNSSSETGFIEVSVYTEQVQKLLADMINLTLAEAIYVLKQSILAYQEIYAKFAAVSISKFYSGLNAQGKLKVWVNDNFSLNCNLQRSPDTEHPVTDVLIAEPAIVNKVIHMIGLLANASCKFFFFGLQKELTLKRFTFNNCLQFINSFMAKTKNLEIPTHLAYMLPKKNSFGLDRSNVKFLANTRFKTQNQPRKDTYFSALNNTNSFKHFGSFVRLGVRPSVQNQNQQENKTASNNQNKFRFKRHSQQLPKNYITSLLPSKTQNKPSDQQNDQNQNLSKKQCKVSLHMIIEKSRRNSIKSTDLFAVRKSNISAQKQRQRPSICIMPNFLNKSARGQSANKDTKQQQNSILNEKVIEKSKKSYSLQSKRSNNSNSLVNSKIGSSNLRKLEKSQKQEENLSRTVKPKRLQKIDTTMNFSTVRKSQPASNIRSRSASANVKFASYEFGEKLKDSKTKQTRQINTLQEVKSHRQSVGKLDKTSTNSISNEGTAKKRSFLTKTNYDSNTDQNEKTQSFCRMDFSSMSIENKISNKNFESEMLTSRKEEMKRSLVSYKFGFQEILQNPSCKQVEEENQTKSYNGSSLRNTQNIAQQIEKPQKKNQETTSNNFSFGNNSNRIQRKRLKDSVQENWDLIREKNEQLLVINQWKKTINNLGELEGLAVNESIIDASNEITRRDPYADVRLQKLDRLGKDMVFSIVKKTEEGAYSLNSSMKRSDVR